MAIRLDAISAGYPGKPVLKEFSLTIEEGKPLAIAGPSGTGKTTILRLLAGLLLPTAGRIEGLTDLRVSMVFQEDRLLPWCTARQNVAAVLPKKSEQEALAALARMELADASEAYPAALSGGMQRRVALARALAYGGDLLLLDEPFKGLDPALRTRIAKELRAPYTVLVTHDPEEAELMGAEVVEVEALA